MIKEQSHSIRTKKVQCNIHGNRLKYKCMDLSCSSPYLCAQIECIDDHFHNDGKLFLTKFDSIQWQNKLKQLEHVINDKSLQVKQEYLTKIVTCFTSSLHKIHRQMNELQNIKQEIRQSSKQPLPFQNLDRFLSLGSKVEKRINSLRSKIIDEDRYFLDKYSTITNQGLQKPNQTIQKSTEAVKIENMDYTCNRTNHSFINSIESTSTNFYKDKNLQNFLNSSIAKFEWEQTQIIFNSQLVLPTCQKFHQKLKDQKHLLFLFIGQNETIGSYYSVPYPTLVQKTKKDIKSFIFIYNKDLNDKFTVFFANKTSQSHITVSEKLLICHGNTLNYGDGIRTFKRNFQSLSYYLPSLSYPQSNSNQEVAYSGVLKIKNFSVIQLNLQ